VIVFRILIILPFSLYKFIYHYPTIYNKIEFSFQISVR